MSNTQFERIIGTHCAPVLLGQKISNLVAMDKNPENSESSLIEEYRSLLAAYDIKIEIICSCKMRMQVFFYNERKLAEYLRSSEVNLFLRSHGYPDMGSTEEITDHEMLAEYLNILKHHFAEHDEFPHEIGLFLGYPVHDVVEFIRQNGKNFKVCRYWKVYEKVEEALAVFSIYDKCKEFVKGRLDAGYNIIQIMNMNGLCA